MLKNWLRPLARRLAGRPTSRSASCSASCSASRPATASSAGGPKPRRRTWLGVEQLEERLAPAVVTINVTTTADEVSSNGQTSLREAIIQANSVTGTDSVVINLQAGLTYTVGSDRDRIRTNYFVPLPYPPYVQIVPFYDTEVSASADPLYGDFDLRRAATINGNGAVVNAAGHGRVFDIRVPSGNVVLNRLWVVGGGGASGHSQGGGIYASGGLSLTLDQVRVSDNSATASGGGVYADFTSSGRLILSNTLVLHNTVAASSGGAAQGGGVYVHGGQVSVSRTEVRDNVARGGDGADGTGLTAGAGGWAYGGGLYTAEIGSLTIAGGKFLSNTADAGVGGKAWWGSNSAVGGVGGGALGGAVYFGGYTGTLTITGSQFDGNQSLADRGGDRVNNANGGNGGSAYGGAVAVSTYSTVWQGASVQATVGDSTFTNNRARGGRGGDSSTQSSAGGSAYGGALAFGLGRPVSDTSSLAVTDTLFQGNTAAGSRGGFSYSGTGGTGGAAVGGAVYAAAGVQTFLDSPFLSNTALAGNGGWFVTGTGGRGGDASGGALASDSARGLTVTGHMAVHGDYQDPDEFAAAGLMQANRALGGSGGTKDVWLNGSQTARAGDGGDARGGAVAVLGGGRTFQSTDLYYTANKALAGNGGNGALQNNLGAQGGNSGTARGGAVYTEVDAVLTRNAFARNLAVGARVDLVNPEGDTLQDVAPLMGGPGGVAPDGRGFSGGTGGSAYGGAVYAWANLTVTGSAFSSNQANGGLGGFGMTGSRVDGRNGADGGSGGGGGSAFGGALAVQTTGTVTLTDTLFFTNVAMGGRGGSGGRGGDASFVSSGMIRGGHGGSGGNAGGAVGGAVWIVAPNGPVYPVNRATVRMTGVYVEGSRALAGDGGFAGNGGYGVQGGGNGGRGGSGGVALGGGVAFTWVVATIDGSTIEQNMAVGGDGAAGGYGGGSSFWGGAGGPGGWALDVRGGGVAFDDGGGLGLNGGSLNVSRSTIVDNQALGGTGGNGGFGGPGQYLGQAGGEGGVGADARGGGVYATPAVTSGTFTNVTVARNVVQAGGGGFGSLGGQETDANGTPVHLQPYRYQAEPQMGQGVALGAGRVVSLGYSSGYVPLVLPSKGQPVVDYSNHAAGLGDGGIGAESIDAGLLGPSPLSTSVIAFAGGLAATGVVAPLLSITATTVEVSAGMITLEGQAAILPVTTTVFGVSSTALFAFSLGGMVLSIGAVLIANWVATGIMTGDWEGALEKTLGTPGKVYPYSFTFLLTGSLGDDGDEGGIDVSRDGPRGDGRAGVAGLAEGAGLYGPIQLVRTLAAGNTGSVRSFSRRTSSDRSSYWVTESVAAQALADVAGGAVEGGGTNQKNLVGAVASGFATSLKGTLASPLDAKLDTETRFSSRGLPTLKPLPGSPARGAVSGVPTMTSENGYTWSYTGDIGAWGGPANRAPTAGAGEVFRTLSDVYWPVPTTALTRGDSDPDGDPLSVTAFAFLPLNGQVIHVDAEAYYPLPGDHYQFLTPGDWYLPNPGFTGQETFTYRVSDGQLVSAKITGTLKVVGQVPTLVTVDDGWAGLEDGTSVLVGTANYFTMGLDAFATVQEGLDAVAEGGEVVVQPGSYTGTVLMSKRATLTGSGRGADPASATILSAGAGLDPALLVPGSGAAGAPLLVRNLRVAGGSYGIDVSGEHVAIDGVTFSGQARIALHTSGILDDLAVSRCLLDGAWVGLFVGDVASSTAVKLTSNRFVNNSYDVWNYPGSPATAAVLDVRGNTFGSVALNDGTPLASLFAIADKVLDRVDQADFGPVVLREGQTYVTQNSFFADAGTTAASLQRAVDAAFSGQRVVIQGGAYDGDVDVRDKGVILSPGGPDASAVATVRGAVVLGDSATLEMTLRGNSPGIDQDQLVAAGGTVTLGGAALGLVTGGFAPAAGASFTLVRSGGISGSFAQGSFMTAGGAAWSIAAGGGQVVVTAAQPTRIIDNSDSVGYSQTGAWTLSTAGGFNGTRSYPTDGPGAGQSTAAWTFTGLAAGRYRVAVTYPAQPNRATDSPFTVLINGAAVAGVAVNQQLAPGDFTDLGQGWKILGDFNVALGGSTLAVRLTDAVAAGYVIADAVRLDRLADVLPVSIIDNSDPVGFSQTGAWTLSTAGGFNGTRSYPTDGPGAGQNTAAWTFTGLAAGRYRVAVTYPALSNRATASPFTLLLNGASLGTVHVNQQVAPGDFLDQGAGWKVLGDFNVSSAGSQLAVRLTDAVAAGYVIADAVRLERLGDVTPVAVLDNSSPAGFSQTGTWTTSTLGGYLGNRSYPTSGAGTGQSTSTWTFGGLAAGQYRVAATWTAQSNRASNSPFTVLVDGTALATQAVNQQQTPGDFVDLGVGWQVLGEFTVARTGAPLAVRLSDAVGVYPAGSGYVIADAVRIERLGDVPAVVIVDDSTTPAFAATGTWSAGRAGGYELGSLATGGPGTGQNVATWTFAGLAAGQYRVAATWAAQAGAASNSPFTVDPGGGTPVTAAVNQRQAPDDFTDQGVAWEGLGTFTVVDGRLVVRLSDLADGAVLADAVRLERVG